MKHKIIFIAVLGLLIAGIFILTYGQVIVLDCLGTVLCFAGGALAVFDTVKYSLNRKPLIPLWAGILILTIIGFVQFKGAIILAAFGFASLGLYIYFRIKKT